MSDPLLQLPRLLGHCSVDIHGKDLGNAQNIERLTVAGVNMLFIQVLQKQLINIIASKKGALHKSLSLNQPAWVSATKIILVLCAENIAEASIPA